MPFSYAQYPGNSSTTTFSVPFPYLLKAHVKLYTGYNVLTGAFTSQLAEGADYTWTSGSQVQTTAAPATGVTLTIIRDTPDSSQLVPWQDGSNLTADDLNNADLQNLYVVQEQQDRNDLGAATALAAKAASETATADVATLTASQVNKDGSVAMTGDLSLGGNKVTDLVAPTLGSDAATKTYVDGFVNQTANIADSAVTTTKVADGAINSDKIADGVITSAKLSPATVVTNAELAGVSPNDTSFYTTSASDGRYFRQDSSETINSGVTWSSSDSFIATTAAIDLRLTPRLLADQSNLPTSPPTTGVYNASGSVGVSTAGVGRLFVDANGKVGLGTSTPGAYHIHADNLVIAGAAHEGISIISGSSQSGNIWFGDADAQGRGVISYSHNVDSLTFSTNGAPKVSIDANGRVGIGTSTPGSYALANDLVLSRVGIGSGITLENATGSGILFKSPSAAPVGFIEYNHSSSKFGFWTNSASRLEITQSGTVNIVGAGSAGSTHAVSFDGSAPINSLVVNSSGNVSTAGTMTADSFIPTSSTIPTNGVYLPSANNVAISSNGTGRLFISDDGKIGIGTSTPSAYSVLADDLVIAPSTASAGISLVASTGNYIFFSDLDAEGRGLITYQHGDDSLRFGTAGYERLYISSTGQIQSAGLGSAASPALSFSTDTNTGIYSPGADQVAISTNGTGRLFVDASGKVGVGTASPAQSLDIVTSGTDAYLRQSNGTVTGFVGVNSNNSAFDIYTFTNHPTRFFTNNTERLRIDSSGRLLVGTSSDIGNESKIQLKDGNLNIYRASASAGAGYGIYFSTDGGATARPKAYIRVSQTAGNGGDLVFSTTADAASSPTERMRIGSNSAISLWGSTNVDTINVVTPNSAGTSYALFWGGHSSSGPGNYGTNSILIYTNGNIANTNNSYGAISDIKLKENIVDAGSQWDDIKALQVRKYNFKEGQTHTQIGLVAQEVELVSPGLVSESPDRDAEGNDLGTVTKSVNYSVLYMKAVKALQEAMERIETLEAKVAALEGA